MYNMNHTAFCIIQNNKTKIELCLSEYIDTWIDIFMYVYTVHCTSSISINIRTGEIYIYSNTFLLSQWLLDEKEKFKNKTMKNYSKFS